MSRSDAELTARDRSQAAIRREMITRRGSLTPEFCTSRAKEIARIAEAEPAISRARVVAFYWPVNGEADPRPVAQRTLAAGGKICLPVVQGRSMVFRTWRPGDPQQPNRLGIPEPTAGEIIEPAALELVLAPLVAFDGSGNRIGMGAGFYDRTFAFLGDTPRRRPLLIGVAYEFQRCDRIEAHPWDVPLDGVLTERGWEHFNPDTRKDLAR